MRETFVEKNDFVNLNSKLNIKIERYIKVVILYQTLLKF